MLSAQEVDEIVCRYFGDDKIQVLNYRQVAHSKDRVGFLGDHQNLEVEIKRFSENNNTDNKKNGELTLQPEKHRFFVKMLPQTSEHQLQFIRDVKVFEQEAAFLTKLAPVLMENLVADDFCPRCLKANERFVVLEDLRARGYSMLEGVRQLEGKHLLAAVKAQARLHAASILAEVRLGQRMNEFCPEACVDLLYNKSSLDSKRVDMFIELVEEVTKRWCDQDHRRVRTALRRGFMRIYQSKGKGKLDRVVCHGDTWPNNYLFKASEHMPKGILVDFQLVRYAPRMYDVAQLLYLGGNREIRQRWEHEAVKAYHEEFCDILEKNNPGIEKPSFEDLWEEYQDVRLSAMYACSLYTPIIRMCPEVSKEFDKELDMFFGKIMLRQDNQVLLDMYDKYPKYRSGMVDLAIELLEYCEKHDIPIKENDVDDEEEKTCD